MKEKNDEINSALEANSDYSILDVPIPKAWPGKCVINFTPSGKHVHEMYTPLNPYCI